MSLLKSSHKSILRKLYPHYTIGPFKAVNCLRSKSHVSHFKMVDSWLILKVCIWDTTGLNFERPILDNKWCSYSLNRTWIPLWSSMNQSLSMDISQTMVPSVSHSALRLPIPPLLSSDTSWSILALLTLFSRMTLLKIHRSCVPQFPRV